MADEKRGPKVGDEVVVVTSTHVLAGVVVAAPEATNDGKDARQAREAYRDAVSDAARRAGYRDRN